jgi:hypothetical protein
MSARTIDPILYRKMAGADVPAAIETAAEHEHALALIKRLMIKEERTPEESRRY